MFVISKDRSGGGRSGESIEQYHRNEVGVWIGEGARALGLVVGEPARFVDGLTPLVAGLHPKTGERLAQRIRRDRVGSFEAVISSPKSVSLAAAGVLPGVSADDARSAYRAGVGVVCGEIERLIAGQGGGGGRAVFVAVEHTRSRAGADHVHTHVILPNLVQRSGRWFAFDIGTLYVAKLWLDSVFTHTLGLCLARFGIASERHGPRHIELRDCPAALIKKHSHSAALVGHAPNERTRLLRAERAFKADPEPQYEGNPVQMPSDPSAPASEIAVDRVVRETLLESQASAKPGYTARGNLLLELIQRNVDHPVSALRRGVQRMLHRSLAWSRRMIGVASGIIRVGSVVCATRGMPGSEQSDYAIAPVPAPSSPALSFKPRIASNDSPI